MSDSTQSTQPMFLRVGYMVGGLLLAVGALLAVVMDTPPIRGHNESLWLQKGIEEEKTKQAQALAEQAQALAQEARYSGGGTLRPSEVPQHLRAETFSGVSSAVPCTAGGQGLESEGINRPVSISVGFELEPGKCFFGKPTRKIRQLEGNNAFMELYNTAGSLKGRCEFTQASIATCSQLHDQALAGQGVLRFGAGHGGFVKLWV